MHTTGGRFLSKPLPTRSSRRTDTRRSLRRSAPLKAVFASGLGIAFALTVGLSAAQEQPPTPPQAAFHLRIANTTHGAVQVSVDGGATWLLIARVNRPALTASPGAATDAREVLRTNRYGMAFGIGKRREIRVLPDNPVNRKTGCSILLNVPVTAAAFKDFLPPAGSPVRIVPSARSEAIPLPEAYYPKDEDVLEFVAPRTSATPEKLAVYARDAADFYLQRCLAKLRASGGKPVNGTLFVSAKLKPGDQPNAVTFLHEGAVAGIMNTPPFSMRWDTREWQDGEHLIEVRALDKGGGILSRSKALVVVQNSAPA